MPGYLDTYVPLPNRAGLVQNNVVQGSRQNDTDQYIGRVDHTFGNATQFFARYVHNAIENHSPTNNPNFFGSDTNRNGNLSTQLTHTFGSSLVFEARFGFNRFEQIVKQNRAFTSPNIAADILQISGVSTDPAASNAPAFIVPGYGGLSGAPSSPRSWYSNRYDMSANISWVKGSHLIRAGGDIVYHRESFPEIIIPNGLYVFDGSFTGHSMADMLLGIPNTFLLSPELFDPKFRGTDFLPWIQDDWRITPKLTLNLGLRYEFRPWPVSANNTLANVVLPPGGGEASVVLSGPCVPAPARAGVRDVSADLDVCTGAAPLGPNDKNNFAPRLGFAYKASDKTVVRGAYGVFYQPEAVQPVRVPEHQSAVHQLLQPVQQPEQLSDAGTGTTPRPDCRPEASSSPTFLRFGHAVSAGVESGRSARDRRQRHGRHLRRQQGQPSLGAHVAEPAGARARRHRLAASVHQRVHHRRQRTDRHWQLQRLCRSARSAATRTGLAYLASYTFAKALTDTQLAETGAFVPDLQDATTTAARIAACFPPTPVTGSPSACCTSCHSATASAGETAPPGSSTGSSADGSWVESGRSRAGQPLTVTLPYDNPNVGEGAKLPDRIGDPNTGPKTVEKFFNTDAFAAPAQYTVRQRRHRHRDRAGHQLGRSLAGQEHAADRRYTASVPRRGVQRLRPPDHG